MLKCDSFGKDETSLGIVPVKALLLKESHVNCVSSPNSLGTVPDSRLPEKSKVLNNRSLPSSLDTGPAKLFWEIASH